MNKIKLIFLTIFCLIACDNSTESTLPEKGTIYGTISFLGDNCPTNNLSIGIYTNWFPTGPPAAFTTINSDSIINNSYDYIISDIEFGTYEAVFVAWQDINTVNEASGQNQQYTLGLYGSTFDYTTNNLSTPLIITLSTTDYEINNIDITASCNLISN